MFFILIGMLFTWVYPFIKTHQILYLKSMHFTVCTFYLNIKERRDLKCVMRFLKAVACVAAVLQMLPSTRPTVYIA